MLLVVAAIVTAIAWTDPGQAISDKLSEIVRDIAGRPVACPRWCGRLLLALALLCVLRAGGAARRRRTRATARVIVLDASKSMNEDAGNGGTRLDAAKKAVGTLVDRLPEGVPLGLRVYGSKVSEVSRAEGCKDTELTVPGRPAGQGRADEHRQRARGQGQDADRPLAAGRPGRSRRRGGAAQRGAGHRRRRQLRAAGPVQGGRAGRQARRRPVDLGRRLPGQRPRAEAAALHRARPAAGPTSTSPTPTSSATSCGAALARVPLLRAVGDQGQGGPTPRRRRRDRRRALPGRARPTSEQRWFAVDVPRAGALIVSVTAIPPLDVERGAASASGCWTRRARTGDFSASDSSAMDGTRLGASGDAAPRASRMRPDDPPGRYVFCAVELEGDGKFDRAGRPGRDRACSSLKPRRRGRADARAGRARDARRRRATAAPRPKATAAAPASRTRATLGGVADRRSAVGVAGLARRARSPPRCSAAGPRRERSPCALVALALLLAAPARAQDRGDAGRRRRLVQHRADPRARDASATRSCPASTSTTASSWRPGSGCTSRLTHPTSTRPSRQRDAACIGLSRSTSTRRRGRRSVDSNQPADQRDPRCSPGRRRRPAGRSRADVAGRTQDNSDQRDLAPAPASTTSRVHTAYTAIAIPPPRARRSRSRSPRRSTGRRSRRDDRHADATATATPATATPVGARRRGRRERPAARRSRPCSASAGS